MTPSDFRAWQSSMGLSVRAAADLLGVAPSTVQDWRTGTSRSTGKPIDLPPMLALACAALATRRWAILGRSIAPGGSGRELKRLIRCSPRPQPSSQRGAGQR